MPLFAGSLEQLGFTQHMKDAFFELAVGHRKRAFPYYKNKIGSAHNLRFVMAHNFLDQPSHPVTDDRVAHLFAYRNTGAELLHLFFRKPIHHELMIGERFPVAVHAAEVGTVSQTQTFLHNESPYPSFGLAPHAPSHPLVTVWSCRERAKPDLNGRITPKDPHAGGGFKARHIHIGI